MYMFMCMREREWFSEISGEERGIYYYKTMK